MNTARPIEFAVPSEPKAKRLSDELRGSRNPHLRNRRVAFALVLTSASSMAVISCYQLGIVKRLPELPIRAFNSEKVNASAEAYSRFSTPDGVLGLVSYATTMTLIASGSGTRARKNSWIPVAAAAKVTLDAAVAIKLTRDEVKKQRSLCSWCMAAAGATFAALPFVWPEAIAAFRYMRNQNTNRTQ